jgi:hypothetical protein
MEERNKKNWFKKFFCWHKWKFVRWGEAEFSPWNYCKTKGYECSKCLKIKIVRVD